MSRRAAILAKTEAPERKPAATAIDTRTRFAMRHALGFNQEPGRKISYRNRYTTGYGSQQEAMWKGLVFLGFAERFAHDKTFQQFCLTRPGAEAVLEPGESLDPEDFPVPA